MANRRMFSKKITDTDLFMDMPSSAQNLYFHLNMNADDDGFVGSPKKIQRTIGASRDDLTILMTKQYIIPFESGVVVIKDWKIHNYIRPDRYYETMYKDEKSMLSFDENNAYKIQEKSGIPNDNQSSYQREPQVRLGKGRLELGKGSGSSSSNNKEASQLKQVFNFWEQNGFGLLAPKTVQDFEYWIKDFEKIGATTTAAIELLLHALGIAVDNGVKKYAYVNSILKDWEQSRYLSVDQVKAEDKKNKSSYDNQQWPDYRVDDSESEPISNREYTMNSDDFPY